MLPLQLSEGRLGLVSLALHLLDLSLEPCLDQLFGIDFDLLLFDLRMKFCDLALESDLLGIELLCLQTELLDLVVHL